MPVVEMLCPNCGAKLKAPDNKAGKKAKCAKCGTGFRLPGLTSSSETTTDVQALSVVAVPGSSRRPTHRKCRWPNRLSCPFHCPHQHPHGHPRRTFRLCHRPTRPTSASPRSPHPPPRRPRPRSPHEARPQHPPRQKRPNPHRPRPPRSPNPNRNRFRSTTNPFRSTRRPRRRRNPLPRPKLRAIQRTNHFPHRRRNLPTRSAPRKRTKTTNPRSPSAVMAIKTRTTIDPKRSGRAMRKRKARTTVR